MSMPMMILKSDFRQNTTYALSPGQRRSVCYVAVRTIVLSRYGHLHVIYLSCNECEKEINCKFNITKLICKIVVHWAFGHIVLINIL